MENFFTDRHGGLSHGDFASFNLAMHVGDEVEHVHANRKLLSERVGPVAFMSQVHGDAIAEVREPSLDAPTADALITDNPNLALAVMVADCIPLLLHSEMVIAAVHVGRAGLLNSVALKTVSRMRELGANSISATIGPSICGSCYEVPEELHDFVTKAHPTASSRTRKGTFALDLPTALKAALETVEVLTVSTEICTFEDENYFSYRRNQVTGRQVGIIKL
jgi:YfiH family protein